MPEWSFRLLFFVLGLLFGSFANVVIWRVPRGESVVSPGSYCPACGAPVRWHDNLPVLSWIALRGRCRACEEPIPRRYPAIELLSALLWLLAAYSFGVGTRAALAGMFFWTLLVLSAIDLETMRLPNPIVGALAGLGILGAVASQLGGVDWMPLTGATRSPLLLSAAGAASGAGVSAAIAMAYAGVRGRQGFGMGDVKLLGVMGLFLGPYVLLALMLGSVFGTIASLVGVARGGAFSMSEKMPFGPFLALAGIATALWGPTAWVWYLSLLGA